MAKGDIMQWLAQHLVPWANKYQENSKTGAANHAAYSEELGVQAANTGCSQWTRKCSFSIWESCRNVPINVTKKHRILDQLVFDLLKKTQKYIKTWQLSLFKKLLWAKLCNNKNLYIKVFDLSILVDCIWRWGLWRCPAGEGRVTFL